MRQDIFTSFNKAIATIRQYNQSLRTFEEIELSSYNIAMLTQSNPYGFTVWSKNLMVKPSKGYAVALNDLGCQAKDNKALEQWLNRVKWLLNDRFTQEYFCIGGWYNPKIKAFELDVVLTAYDKDTAIKIAKDNDQISVFDLEKEVEIKTGGLGGNYLPLD